MKTQANRTLLLSTLALLTACRAGPTESTTPSTGIAAHAVHSARIQQIMRQLGRLASERMPQELDTSVERARRATEVAEIARAMAASAEDVSGAMSRLELTTAQQGEFTRLVDQLRTQSTELARTAPRLSLAQMKDRMAAIRGSCKACHDRFRIPN